MNVSCWSLSSSIYFDDEMFGADFGPYSFPNRFQLDI
jgi:hypothetical protein